MDLARKITILINYTVYVAILIACAKFLILIDWWNGFDQFKYSALA